MEIETSSAIRLFFHNSSLQLIYFEALANSLDADATEVQVEVDIPLFKSAERLSIKIIDNGIGFNEENFIRFKTLLKPRDDLHKGLGRLVFLKYFKKVEIVSTWDKFRREFIFKDGFDGASTLTTLNFSQENKTTLFFTGFSNKKIKSYDDLRPSVLKSEIINHFLPTLISFKNQKRDFRITVKLNTQDKNFERGFFSHEEIITADDLPRMSELIVEDHGLDLHSDIKIYYHVNLDAKAKGTSLVAFSIDGRTIPINNLIPPSSFPSDHHCIFLFESELFNSHSDSSRQKIIFPDHIDEKKLYQILRGEIGKILSEKIPHINELNKNTQKEFEAKFPHLLGFFETDTIGLIDKDSALNTAQQKFFQKQKEVLQSEHLSDRNYEKALELSSRTLTEYILYREKIIDKMTEFSEENKESEIHDLIVPKFSEYCGNDVSSNVYQNNAWLLDDKFMVFRTILSEKRMDKVINAIRLDDEKVNDNGRPDITMIFSADPLDVEAVDVVVVEIKKKTDDEKENQYAVNQLMKRARKLVEFCPKIQRVWFYAVIQVNDEMAIGLRQQNWSPLYSRGKVFYQEFKTEKSNGHLVPTPTFIMSFDAIVNDAKNRNHIFLEILRDSMKKFS
ncbi:ATP-binding protein [Acinetobacter guerrae]|uniref:ATP-binding protein n=1 Tax=Acinetobacter guerrae TaxID=1843371 RepID=UPI00128B2CCE|nr:ATP-binding protein [Acinetobacter guerrae]MPW43776.1 histidine kinase [Acinetobacter guerrae]